MGQHRSNVSSWREGNFETTISKFAFDLDSSGSRRSSVSIRRGRYRRADILINICFRAPRWRRRTTRMGRKGDAPIAAEEGGSGREADLPTYGLSPMNGNTWHWEPLARNQRASARRRRKVGEVLSKAIGIGR